MQNEEELEKAIAQYKPRPENAIPSRKKDQRFAEEARQAIKERKRLKAFQEKQLEEEQRKKKRLELFDRLKVTSLDKATRDGLSSSSTLAKPIANAQRELGKPGERQRRKARKKSGVAAVTVVQHDSSSSSESEAVTEEEEEKAPIEEESSSEEEEEEEEKVVVLAKPEPVEFAPKPLTAPKLAFVVSPVRTPEVEESRSALTIVSMEQEIMEQINDHDVVFVCGDTGSGKTTQVPQMLLEAGFGCVNHKEFPGLVAVTQPRRFAAISVAERVGVELNCPVIGKLTKHTKLGNRTGTEAQDLLGCVGYQIRHDQTTCHSQSTRIKFMTDGILLAELKEDFLLKQYSTIVMDEVHERGLNSDLLLGLLSRIVPMRRKMYEENGETGKSRIMPLKLVIMSATMDIDDFQALGFSHAPVIQVSGARQFTVTPHFAKRTEQVDYLNATFRKCCQVHEKLPARQEGGDGILVFLTGQREIDWFCRKLGEKYNDQFDDNAMGEDGEREEQLELAPLGENDEDDDFDNNDKEARLVMKKKKKRLSVAAATAESESEEEASELSGLEEDERVNSDTCEVAEVHVVPLYSRLSAEKQKRVFAQIPPGKRLIVVATNVAETSLTIPNIRYVVDSGREKRRVYDQRSGTSSFRVEFVSQSSAKQRMGRAGRTSNGHCYRLYSTAVYENLMDPKSLPETSNVPIDDLVLYMKNLGMDNIVDFPFPNKLDPVAIHNSLVRLKQLGVLSTKSEVTNLGAQLAKLPVSVRVAKTLTLCVNEPKCAPILPHCVTLCALLSLPSPFDVSPKTNFRGDASSDAICLLRAAGAYSHIADSARMQFCDKYGLNYKTMKESELLASQLARKVLPSGTSLNKLAVLTPKQESLLKQAVIAGLIDHVARRVADTKFHKLKANETPYVSCDENLHGRQLYIHPHSVLLSDTDHDLFALPEFVCYSTVSGEGRMEACTQIEPDWLRALSFGTSQCQDRLLTTPEPQYDSKEDAVVGFVKPEFGPGAWALPIERRVLEKETKLIAQTFARGLLEGAVVGPLLAGGERAQWVDPPAHCTRAPFQPRVVKLVNRLLECKVWSRKALLAKLAEDAQFLLPELSTWVKAGEVKSELEQNWARVARGEAINSLQVGKAVNWT
ncbi:hypothetical protein BASA81_000838 [Batrachochytrium salamandrivorans]|nr:hypothetical protein BASA81_000838 [Batrachochytrium salamandrivorans]